jgi:hypothetical protein
VIGIWALAGATAGTSIGVTLQLTGRHETGASTVGIAGMVVFAILGGLAFALERKRSESRPQVLDGRGRSVRPIHGGVYAAPIGLAMPAVLWLMVVGSVGTNSLIPALAFGVAALGMAWAVLRILSTHRLTRALEDLENGHLVDASEALRTLQGSVFVRGTTRTVARLNLGTLALQQGRLDDAAGWLSGISTGQAGAHARVGLALVHILQGRTEAARGSLAQAMSGQGARAVQDQADAVRILVVLDEEGPFAALEFGERVLGPQSSGLHMALVGALRSEPDDMPDALLSEARAAAILSSGLGAKIPVFAERVPLLVATGRTME